LAVGVCVCVRAVWVHVRFCVHCALCVSDWWAVYLTFVDSRQRVFEI